jgi:hypothetical protein
MNHRDCTTTIAAELSHGRAFHPSPSRPTGATASPATVRPALQVREISRLTAASQALMLCLLWVNAACSSQNCDDIGCSPGVQLSATFESDGEWRVELGAHGSCDVTVTSNRATSASCSRDVRLSSSPDADVFLIDATPKTLTISFSGVEDGSKTVTPQYEDRKPGCSVECLVAESRVRIGAE